MPPAVTQRPTPPAPVPRPPQETCSVVVTDVPVKDVIFALARDAGVNVEVSGDLQGKVTQILEARGDDGSPRAGSVQGNATVTAYALNTNYDLAYSF